MQYSDTAPQPVVTLCRLGQRRRTVNYDIAPAPDGQGFSFRSVTLPLGVWGYDQIVSAIVTDLYPADRMQAVVNNYLADPADPGAAAEMAQMQQWRAHAKEIAHALTD